MQCPNCKKDLVFGEECAPCKPILGLSVEPVVEIETSEEDETEEDVPVKKVVEKPRKKTK